MAKRVTIPYSGESLATYTRIKGLLGIYAVNQLYINTSLDVCFYINSKGYMHILTAEKAECSGERLYIVNDNLLTTRGEIKQFDYEIFDTKENLQEYFNQAIRF